MLKLQETLLRMRSRLEQKTGMPGSEGQAPTYTVAVKCPICHDFGFVYDEQPLKFPNGKVNPSFGKAVPCTCRKQSFEDRRRLSLLSFCGLPKGTEHMTFENFQFDTPGYNPMDLQTAFNATVAVVSQDLVFNTIIGDVNAGKTHLAVAAAREYIAAGIPAKYIFTANLLDGLRNTYDRGENASYHAIMEKYTTVQLLILDDLYRQRVTEWGSEKLMQIINTRVTNQLATIFTTNKTLEEITRIDPYQGQAIVSRLQREEWCNVTVIHEAVIAQSGE